MTDEIDTLEKFGMEFQRKCLAVLLKDKIFLEQVTDILDPKYFESESHEWIVNRILWYGKTYRDVPTFEVLIQERNKLTKEQNDFKGLITDSLMEIYAAIKQGDLSDSQYVKDEVLTFCKNQALKKAVLRSAELLQTGKYDQIKGVIDKAMNAGASRDVGHNWNTDIEVRVNKQTRNVVPTPWDSINELIDGGLGAGEVGTVLGLAGSGKSFLLTAIGKSALEMGKCVAHYTLELSETYMGLRYDSVFTQIEPNKIKDNVDHVRQAVSEVPGQLFIKYYPTRSITVNAIRAHLQQLRLAGYIPDLLIVDYADLMRSVDKTSARWEELGFIHEDLRQLCGELKVPCWTGSQAQRAAAQDDVIESDKIAGSFGKIMTDDLVISLSRKMADKLSKTARIHIVKNRMGVDGISLVSRMDLAKGIIEIYNSNSPQGQLVNQQMRQGEADIKQTVLNSWVDYKKKKKDEEKIQVPPKVEIEEEVSNVELPVEISFILEEDTPKQEISQNNN